MSKFKVYVAAALFDPVSGALVGFLGQDGKEYSIAVAPMSSAGVASPATGLTGLNIIATGSAAGTTLTNPLVQATNNVNNFTQSAIQNLSAGVSASSDHICYPNNNANDTTGFVDMGVTGTGFADGAYACTGPGDAYLFGSAVAASGANGNLVVWTDATGARNDIVFGTNGFNSAANERMRIKKGGQVRYLPLAAAPTDNVQEGDVYYNSTLHKLQVRTAAAWETITSV